MPKLICNLRNNNFNFFIAIKCFLKSFKELSSLKPFLSLFDTKICLQNHKQLLLFRRKATFYENSRSKTRCCSLYSHANPNVMFMKGKFLLRTPNYLIAAAGRMTVDKLFSLQITAQHKHDAVRHSSSS